MKHFLVLVICILGIGYGNAFAGELVFAGNGSSGFVKEGTITRVTVISQNIDGNRLNRVWIVTTENKKCAIDTQTSSSVLSLANLIKSNLATVQVRCIVDTSQVSPRTENEVVTTEFRLNL